MIEGTMGTTSKFDVFYGWASFFVRENMKEGEGVKSGLEHGNGPVRIYRNPQAGLNIVPVDYCAKLMLAICHDDNRGGRSGVFHLAHDHEVSHDQWITQSMSQLGFENYLLTDCEPINKSAIEQRYYRTVGKLFQGYLSSESLQFDMSNSREIRASIGLNCPVLDEAGFAKLLSFANALNFGVPVKNGLWQNFGRKIGLAHPAVQRLIPRIGLKRR